MAEKKKKIKVNPVAERILRPVLRLLLNKWFNVKLELSDEIRDLKPPFLLLPNHQGFWDPFLAGIYLKAATYYITSDAVFRSRLFGFILKFLGAIPKTKNQSDMDALKNIFELKEQGCSIGIFPEGQRTFDGMTLPLILSTSKLIRMLKIPVVTAVFKGGYFSHPRWGTSMRKGEITIEYTKLFNGDEVGSMKVSDIHQRLTEALAHDEIEYQKQKGVEFKTGKLAENIEQFLFACPHCDDLVDFKSTGDSFTCIGCGKEWRIDSRQNINAVDGNTVYDNIRDWSRWQTERLHRYIDERFESGEEIFKDGPVDFHTGYKTERLKPFGSGLLKLIKDEIILIDMQGDEYKKINLKDIAGVNVQNRDILDFYSENTLFTCNDKNRRFNAYKWWRALDYLQREKLKMNLPD